ncbi:MAG: adenosylmethionine--8-amino-7-oxononanoate transaminase [Actinomycetota bacterium]
MTSDHTRRLADLDHRHLWHPFTQMLDWLDDEPLIIERAEGFELIDTEGRRYLDGVSSLWVSVHGHRVPEIDQAISEQLGRIAHSTLLGLGGTPSIELAARLVQLAPPGIEKVFFSEAGAAAVEVGLKMAFGYWQHRGVNSKRTFLALEKAYHGDTLGAVSVGGMDLFHSAYRPLLFDVYRAPSPYHSEDASLAAVEETFEKYANEICAFILEPLVQAAAGMLTAPPGYLRKVRELCDRYDVLLICDEVATGAGRTGTFFACEQEDVAPDIIVAGKGLSGGYLPIAATMTTQAVFDAFLAPYAEFHTFFHGHTYTGNALTCAAALANLALMEERDTVGGVREREAVLAKLLDPLRDHPHVAEIRQRGMMIGIELVRDRATTRAYEPEERTGHRVIGEARKNGVIIRPLGDVIVLMPPLATPIAELERLVSVTAGAIDAVTLP